MLSLRRLSVNQLRTYATNVGPSGIKDHYYLVVVGGGAGGLAIASRFTEVLTVLDKGKVAVIEPGDTHYYQPMWTLVGAGIKKLSDSARPTAKVMPKKVQWIKERCIAIDPDQQQIRLTGASGIIKYDFLLVATGVNIDWQKIKGLPEAFNTPGVCSNYSVETVNKTFPAIQATKEGNAIFTFPNGPIKCAGAPQKIMYLSDAYWRQNGVRDHINVIYNTAGKVIFGAPKYAKALTKICEDRKINVNYSHNLVEVIPDKKEAVFENLETKEKKRFTYNMLHVSPPMSPSPILAPIADPQTGFVAVNKETLQHVKYKNIFAIGDCTNAPTSKTAAAAAAQSAVVSRNLYAQMKGKQPYAIYDGYTSCPLLTGNNKCIMAEFDYNMEPLETFPFDQSKERKSMYFLKKEVLPTLYWNLLLKGMWSGPTFWRRVMHLGFSK